MTSTLTWLQSVAALVPALIPWLLIIWMAAVLLALIHLGIDRREGHRPEQPPRAGVLNGLCLGGVMTIYLIASEAHSHALIARWLFVLLTIGACLAAIGLQWLLQGRDSEPRGVG